MPRKSNKRTRADGSTNAVKLPRPDGVLTTAGNLIASFFGRVFRSDAGTYKRPKFAYQASLNANINRWTGQPHVHAREIARTMKRRSGSVA